MATIFTVTIAVDNDDPATALRSLQDLLDHDGRIDSYTTESYTNDDGEEIDTKELM